MSDKLNEFNNNKEMEALTETELDNVSGGEGEIELEHHWFCPESMTDMRGYQDQEAQKWIVRQ